MSVASRLIALAAALVAVLACAGTPDGPPARSGRYACANGGSFTVNAAGTLDNGDNMSCETGEGGAVLNCHGFRRAVVWRELPDKSVETDVLARLYGESSPPQVCAWAPLGD